MHMVNYYEISGLTLRCEMPFQQNIFFESAPFLLDRKAQREKLNFRFIPVDSIVLPAENGIREGDTMHYLMEDRYVVYHSLGNINAPYARVTWRFDDIRNVSCEYSSDRESEVNCSRNLFNLMGLENLLLIHHGFLLHSSFINFVGAGILFTAPSGTGKSTQADLWKKYEGADILNGDRAGVRKVNNEWRAWGLPHAGTSGIYRNESAPVKAVVVLRQAKENRLRRLSPAEAMRFVYPEVTVHRWDPKFVDNSVNLILDLLASVPVYLLECLPNRGAVEILKEELVTGGEKV